MSHTRNIFAVTVTDLRSCVLRTGLFILLLAVGTNIGFAQAASGITGTVTDKSGAVIPGAAVTITNNDTQTSVNTVTTSAGTYAATGLLPGRYTVTALAPNFSKSVKNQVNIEVSVTATIDFNLVAGSNDQTVSVTADLISLNTTQPELGTTIEPEVVRALPVAIGGGRGRQIDTLQFLAPGTQGNTFSHRINGGVDFESEIIYNGIPVPQSETAGYTSNFNPPFELVNEFRVERSTFSAQYGLAQGAVTYQMASGTNAIHGDAFLIDRNTYFDAKGYYNDTTPADKENNYGFTVAGPVVIPHLYNGHDKTFFHFSLDFSKVVSANTSFGTVPSALEKTGNFSDLVDGKGNPLPIFDPLTGKQFQYGGRLNVIDPARFSKISQGILSFIPDPDLPGVTSNKRAVPNAYPTINHTLGFVVDHNINEKQSIHYTQWRNPYSSSGFDHAPIVPQTNPLMSLRTFPTLGTVYLLNYTNAVTPKLVATAGFGWVGEINNQFATRHGVTFPAVQSSPIGDVFPAITFDGTNSPTSYGTGGGNSGSVNRKLGIAIVNNWLWSKGRNTFNIGGEFRRTYQDDNECQNCGGQFNFSQRTTADPNNIGSTGSSFASFLLGEVDSANRVFANELRLRNLSLSPYIQDDFKATPKLTVNLGIRWDILRPFTENGNQVVYVNPTAPNPAAGGLLGTATQFGTCAGCANLDRAAIHWKNFGPRLGFAYAINDRMVIQGGFSLSYLDGGAYEYGTSKVAVSYGNLLQGAFTRNSTNGTAPAFGSWDANVLPAPAKTILGPRLGFGTTIRAFDPKRDGLAPYVQQWNVQLQRQLPFNTFLNVAYIGNRAVHLPGQLNPPNQPDPSILQYGSLLSKNINDPAVVAAGFKSPYPSFAADFGKAATLTQALKPFPQYASIYNNFDLSGAANYSGLQASLEKRFSNGLSFLTSYTLSKTMSNVDSGFSTFAGRPVNKYNQYPEWTVAGNDIRNNGKVSGTYELPIGPGKRFLNNKGITGQILGGLQIGWIATYYSGTPFGIGENDNPLGGGNRPDRVSSVPLSTKYVHPTGRSRVTVSSIPAGAFVSTSGTYRLGNALRNYNELRNPGYSDEDFNARKKFALGEHASFILTMNYFNVLNRTLFRGPSNNINNSDYGLAGVGQSNTPRQGQIEGRIVF